MVKFIMLFYYIQVDSVHKVRDFAFVHFHSHAAAKTALNRTNGKLVIDDEEVQVLVICVLDSVDFQEDVLRGLWVVKVPLSLTMFCSLKYLVGGQGVT
jgi:RNA recognition motif-containing protein